MAFIANGAGWKGEREERSYPQDVRLLSRFYPHRGGDHPKRLNPFLAGKGLAFFTSGTGDLGACPFPGRSNSGR